MFEHILVPLDGSPLAECVLPHVVAIANAYNAHTTLLQVLSRTESAGQLVDPLSWQISKTEARNYLAEIDARLQAAGLESGFSLIDGQAANGIIEFAHQHQIQLIIISSHGSSGLSIWNVSGVVQKIVQRAHLPAMIVRAHQSYNQELDKLRYQTILIPLDLSQRAECALPIATRLAGHFGSRLVVAHIVTRPEMPRQTAPSAEDIELVQRFTERNMIEADKYLRQLESRLLDQNLHIETRLLVRDNVASALHELTEQERASLVVMSAHGYSGETCWPYGNVVEKFITYGTTPLLIYQDFSPKELRTSQMETGFVPTRKD